MSRHVVQRGFRTFDNMTMRFASQSVAPRTSTGIEHAESFTKSGLAKPVDSKLYKCDDYLKFGKYSYYDLEVAMSKHRVAQPSNKKPDAQPRVKS